tara:strand:+ start:158 stop:1297 length:1140 start_codon:yes stop_codon:yes gene_type:complete
MANLAETLASIRSQHQSNQEQQFFTGLMQYGIDSGGQFDIENDTPIYTGGGELPPKTVLWNQFVSMKRGRLSAIDVQNFEAQYAQAKAMKSQKQMTELQKLRTRGYSDKKIQKAIKDSPQLYNNLIDMVSDLENSGNEQAFAQAQGLKTFLPEMDTGGLIGDIQSGEGGMLSNVIAPGLLIGAPSAYAFAKGRGAEAVKDAAKTYRTQRRAVTSDINDAKKSLTSKTQEIKDKAKTISDKQKKLKKPNLSKPLQKMKTDKKALNVEKKALQTKVDDLTKKRSSIKIKDPGSRLSRLNFKGKFVPGFGTAMAASIAAPKVGEFIAGEEGKEPASALTNLGLLGYGLSRKNPAMAWTGGLGLGMQAWDKSKEIRDYFFGDE